MLVKINSIKPHPCHLQIYSPISEGDLQTLSLSLKKEKLLYPLKVTADNYIISGVRRWEAAKKLGWKKIEIEVLEGDENYIKRLLVSSNNTREKTHAERINEVMHLLTTLGDRQGQRNLPTGKKGCRYEIVSNIMGEHNGFSRENIRLISEFQKYDNAHRHQTESLISMVKNGNPIHKVNQLLKNVSTEDVNDIKKIIKKEGIYTLYNESCDKGFYKIEDGEIKLVFTSPPYFRQRIYRKGETRDPKQLGEEDNVSDYCSHFEVVAKEIYRVLDVEGSFYLNISDTIIDGECMMVPDKLCTLLANLGFKLVNRIAWVKKNPKPLNPKIGYQPNYEFIFHFVKDSKKYFNRPLKYKKVGAKNKISKGVKDRQHNTRTQEEKFILESEYRRFPTFFEENKGYADVVRTSVSSLKSITRHNSDFDHPAIFDEMLPFIALLQSSKKGDKVLDCFSGSGTFAKVASLFGREAIGIEINPEYHRIAAVRMEETQKHINPKIIKMIEKKIAA